MTTRLRGRIALAATLIAGSVAVAAMPADAGLSQRGTPGAVSLSVEDATAYESDGVISFPVTLSAPAAKDLRINAVPLPGTARPVQDYRPGRVSTVIPRGATEGLLEVTVFDDGEVGPDTSFTLRIGSAPGVRIVDGEAVGTIRESSPFTVNLLHVNDHHSNLEPTNNRLNLGTSGDTGIGAFTVPFGGFPQVTAKIAELESQLDNVVKVHAGDAITGTLYYTLFGGAADAALMNTVCFDVFTIGNHEFDDGDANLANFLDFLNADPNCDTAAISANTIPAPNSPLAPNSATDYIQPYAIEEFDGQQVAFIGITVADKTKGSSQPDPETQFLDEVETTQYYVNELASMGIHNVVVVTHQGYQNDLALAAAVTGVDAIVGGDSHNLLGNFQRFGLPSVGEYPTVTQNADGDLVCVVQAWQYSWVVGQLGVTFQEGTATGCDGTPHLLLGDRFTRSVPNLSPPPSSITVDVDAVERQAILDIIEATPELSIVTPDPEAAAILKVFTDQLAELRDTVVGESKDLLCTRRVPNLPQGSEPCSDDDYAAPSGARLAINGGFIQQIVSDAFLARSFEADLALQNGGGVRVTQDAGDVTIGDIYTILPFNNTLVNLTLSGAEVKQSVEDALNRFAANPENNTGAFPYGSGIRWDIDFAAGTNNRINNLQVRDRDTGEWSLIDLNANYVVVTNSFLAGGGDGAATFKAAADDGRIVDTFINYAQGLFDYIVQDLDGAPLVVPPPQLFSTQSHIGLPPPPPPPA
jgi:5'-nucleotidase / UDP-sugar diphosphatase